MVLCILIALMDTYLHSTKDMDSKRQEENRTGLPVNLTLFIWKGINMKMTKEHYNHIKSTIESKLKSLGYTLSDAIKLCRDSGYNDITTGWYLLNGSDLNSFVRKELYPYLKDTHIDTALKSIIKSA